MQDTQLLQTLSAQEIATIEDLVSHLPDRASAAIEALQVVQAERGWVSNVSLNAIAALLHMSPAELDSIATFYNLIFRQPVGRHVVMACDSVSCFVMGSEALRSKLQEKLGVPLGGTTPDGRFTLLPIVCLGACDRAPALLVDDQLLGNVAAEQLDDLLARFE